MGRTAETIFFLVQHLRQLCWWSIDHSGQAAPFGKGSITQEAECMLVMRADILETGRVKGSNWWKTAKQDAGVKGQWKEMSGLQGLGAVIKDNLHRNKR